MGDVMREMVGDPYAGLYDCDPYPALVAEMKEYLDDLRACEARGEDHPAMPPWGTIEQEIRETERMVEGYEAKIKAGILTAVQDAARTWEEAFYG